MKRLLPISIIFTLLITSIIIFPLNQPRVYAGSIKMSAMIAAGKYHSLAVKDDGTVWGWGYNNYSQLGNSTEKMNKKPISISGLTEVAAVAADENYSLALKNDGTVWAWGSNEYGELGDGTEKDRTEPVQVSQIIDITAIAAGSSHALALKKDGTVWAWGRNLYGQLGDATTQNKLTPVRVRMLSDVIAVAAGNKHSIALKRDGTVWAWGYNSDGELGTGTDDDSNIPVQVYGLSDIKAISAGAYHNIAVKSDGTVWAWGDNSYSQLANAVNGENSKLAKMVSGIDGAAEVSAGYYHSMILKSDGTVWTWGSNKYGQLGNGKNSEAIDPVEVVDIPKISAITTDGYHSLAAESNGTMWAWGKNDCGQLGDSTTADSSIAMKVKDFNLYKKTSLDDETTLSPENPHADIIKCNLKAVLQKDSVVVEWDKINDKRIVGYYVYRTKSSGSYSYPTTDFPIAGTTYIDEYVEQGTTYYYVVKALYSDGSESAASNEVSVVLQLDKPQKSSIVLQLNNPNMYVDGICKEIDTGKGTTPVLVGGRTLVPIRAIIEAMNGKLVWDAGEQKISLIMKDKELDMWIGKKSLKINGQEKEIDAAPQIINERTMLPLRFVTENLGCTVQWDGASKRITILFEGAMNHTGNTDGENVKNDPGSDNTAEYYVKDGKQFILSGQVLFEDSEIYDAVLSPDKQYVAYTNTHMEINVYDIKNREKKMVYEMKLSDAQDKWRVRPVAWTTDSQNVIYQWYYYGIFNGGNKYYQINRNGGDPVLSTYMEKE